MKASSARKPPPTNVGGSLAADLLKDDLEGVLAFAKENRDRVKFWWPTSTDMVLGLTRKDCAAGNMHSPEMLQTLRSSPELAAVVPTPTGPSFR